MMRLLKVVAKFASESDDATRRISSMLNEIGNRLEILNDYAKGRSTEPEKIKQDSVKINSEILGLWLEIILFFEKRPGPARSSILEAEWKPVCRVYEEAVDIVQKAVDRVNRLVIWDLSRKQKEDVEIAQQVFPHDGLGNLQGPYFMGPAPTNAHNNPKFFSRTLPNLGTGQSGADCLEFIDKSLGSDIVDDEMRSLAIHGMGGVGKSQIAYAFACTRGDKFNPILWIDSESPNALAQSFNRVALEYLKLKDAIAGPDNKNRVQVKRWLAKTGHKWLLIFDNAERREDLDMYLPMGGRGSFLITSRKSSFASPGGGLEIFPFSHEEGSRFLLYLLSREITPGEREASLEVAKDLDGHALAINQMAAYIRAKRLSIRKFSELYKKNPRRVQDGDKPGWAQGGYSHSLNTVFKLSFEELSDTEWTLMGILSLMSPDAIPYKLLVLDDEKCAKEPAYLQFCQDDFRYVDDALERLLEFALIRKDPLTEIITVHRLVQEEFKHYMMQNRPDTRQDIFQGASKLLRYAFPHQINGRRMDHHWTEAAQYFRHVLSLQENVRRILKVEGASVAKDIANIEFCELTCDAAWNCVERHALDDLEKMVELCVGVLKESGIRQQNPLLLAHIYNSAGRLWSYRGEFERAEDYLNQCLTIRSDVLPKDDDEMANIHNNLGNLYLSRNELENALESHQKAYDIRSTKDKDCPNELAMIMSHHNLFRVYLASNEIDEAKKHIDQAQLRQGNWHMHAFTLYLQGQYYLKIGQKDTGLAYFQDCKEYLQQNGQETSVLVASAGYYIGYLHLSKGCIDGAPGPEVSIDEASIDEAIRALEGALAVLKIGSMPENYTAGIYYLLSQALAKKNNSDGHKAQDYAALATSVAKKLLKETYNAETITAETYRNFIECTFR
ncbi:hypothetical protein TWF718_003755 [Orbilia javanica]|uniref:NB-ARC domain-containing protein n=1 Tax=Orbilia javanica TaxID=47235 RepID=A0AAN8NAB0_9PEZI